MKWLVVLFFILAVFFIGYAETLQPFTNKPVFNSQVSQMTSIDTEKYDSLRQEMATPKYELQDYGITLALLALTMVLLAQVEVMMALRSRWAYTGLALAVSTLTSGALFFDLMQGSERLEFPPWADSLGIPALGVPFVFMGTLIWAFLHLLLLGDVPTQPIPLRLAWSRQSNKWLLMLIISTTFILLCSLVSGAYWFAAPAALWLYFYVSVAAILRSRVIGGDATSPRI